MRLIDMFKNSGEYKAIVNLNQILDVFGVCGAIQTRYQVSCTMPFHYWCLAILYESMRCLKVITLILGHFSKSDLT